MRSARGAFQVASFRGIPIRLHYSLLLALPLLALIYGSVVRQAAREAHAVPELSGAEPYLWGLGVAVGLFASVLLHEMAHVFYALRTGGQVRSITLMIVGGVSEVTELPRRHRDEVLMALLGPVTSVVLGVGLLALVALLPGIARLHSALRRHVPGRPQHPPWPLQPAARLPHGRRPHPPRAARGAHGPAARHARGLGGGQGLRRALLPGGAAHAQPLPLRHRPRRAHRRRGRGPARCAPAPCSRSSGWSR